MKTRTLQLPHPAAELFETVYPALHDFVRPVTPGNIVGRLGGGTALAAQWGHRRSTDIDITVPEGTGLNAYVAYRLGAYVARYRNEAPIDLLAVAPRFQAMLSTAPQIAAQALTDLAYSSIELSYPDSGVALRLRTVASVEGKEFRYASARALVEALPALGLEPYFMAFHGTVERMVERVGRSIAAGS